MAVNAERMPADAVECRASEDGPTLRGVIVPEGRAATGGRAEVFAPGSVTWPPDGVAILDSHHGRELGRAVPVRDSTTGEIRIATKATPAMFQAVQSGRDKLSVEFFALRESRTRAGVREIARALVDRVALVTSGEYAQAIAEVRSRRRKVWL